MNPMDGRPRDNQRQRLYTAEDKIHDRRPSRAARKHLIDTQAVNGWGVLDEHGKSKPMKAPTIAALQDYVDAVTAAAWFQSRWGRRKLTVIPGQGSHAGGSHLTVSPYHRRSEAVILHEIAHTLTPSNRAWHGPEFAGILLTLVRFQMGAEHARELRESFRAGRVRVTMKDVPKAGSRPVVTAAKQAAKQRARDEAGPLDKLGLTDATQCRAAAAVIRKKAKAGVFGPPGSKPRRHALDTARKLDGDK